MDKHEAFTAVREWKSGLEVQRGTPLTPLAQFAKMVEEVGEYFTAVENDDAEEKMDAIGDVIVTAIALAEINEPGAFIEPMVTISPDTEYVEVSLGLIANGVLKGNPAAVTNGCVAVIQHFILEAQFNGFHYLDDCLVPVIGILKERLNAGYTIGEHGDAVKAGS